MCVHVDALMLQVVSRIRWTNPVSIGTTFLAWVGIKYVLRRLGLLTVGTDGIIHHEIRVGGVKAIHFANFVSNLPDGRPLYWQEQPSRPTIIVDFPAPHWRHRHRREGVPWGTRVLPTLQRTTDTIANIKAKV